MSVIENVNVSGLFPLEYNCLIKLDKVEQKSSGGIVLIESMVEKDQWAETQAIIVAMGAKAFSDGVPERIGDEIRKPQVGDRVRIRQYTVYRIEGADDEFYCLVVDKDILAVVADKKL